MNEINPSINYNFNIITFYIFSLIYIYYNLTFKQYFAVRYCCAIYDVKNV